MWKIKVVAVCWGKPCAVIPLAIKASPSPSHLISELSSAKGVMIVFPNSGVFSGYITPGKSHIYPEVEHSQRYLNDTSKPSKAGTRALKSVS